MPAESPTIVVYPTVVSVAGTAIEMDAKAGDIGMTTAMSKHIESPGAIVAAGILLYWKIAYGPKVLPQANGTKFEFEGLVATAVPYKFR